MQSRQTFLAAMGGVDPGEEAFGEYDEARRRRRPPTTLPLFLRCFTRTCVRPGAGRVHGRAVVIEAFRRAMFVHRLCTPPLSQPCCARQRRVSVVRYKHVYSSVIKEGVTYCRPPVRLASYFYLPPEGLQHGAWRDGGLHAAHPRSHCTQA